jgi:uncharacterized membrane protein
VTAGGAASPAPGLRPRTAARSVLRLVLAAAGLAVAAYLTLQHYDSRVPLSCPNTGIIDCERVLTSPQSLAFGVPLAVWGLGWFAVAVALAAAGASAAAEGAWWGRPARLLWTAVGAAAVVYFVYLELLVIGSICIWCSTVHAIVLALLALEATDGGRVVADELPGS